MTPCRADVIPNGDPAVIIARTEREIPFERFSILGRASIVVCILVATEYVYNPRGGKQRQVISLTWRIGLNRQVDLNRIGSGCTAEGDCYDCQGRFFAWSVE